MAFEWTDENTARLRELWNAGLSTKKIGYELGCSKNAVIGRARRIGLDGRASPIKNPRPNDPYAKARWMLSVRYSVSTVAKKTGIPEEAIQEISTRPKRLPPVIKSQDQIALPFAAIPRPALKPVIVAPPPPLPAVPVGRVRECCWPIGEPRAKDFRYCDAPSVPGRPYCDEHYKVAYMKTPASAERLAYIGSKFPVNVSRSVSGGRRFSD